MALHWRWGRILNYTPSLRTCWIRIVVVLKLNELLLVYFTMHIAERKGTDWINRHSPYCEGWFSSLRNLGRITFVGYLSSAFLSWKMDCVLVAYLLSYARLCKGNRISLSSTRSTPFLNVENVKTLPLLLTLRWLLPVFGLHDQMVGSSCQQQIGQNVYLMLYFNSTDFFYMVYYSTPSIPQ